MSWSSLSSLDDSDVDADFSSLYDSYDDSDVENVPISQMQSALVSQLQSTLLSKWIPPHPRLPLSPILPPLPCGLNQLKTFEEVTAQLDAWVSSLSLELLQSHHETVCTMIDQMKETFRGKFDLRVTVQPCRMKLALLTDPLIIRCEECHKTPTDPYILPNCTHIYCGQCLDNRLRVQLDRRVKTSTLTTYDGKTIAQALQSYPSTEFGFQLALRDAGAPPDFTTLLTPCCAKRISRSPRQLELLTRICSVLKFNEVYQSRVYFGRMFMEED